MNRLIALIVVWHLSSLSWGLESVSCMGGEGPGPMYDLSQILPPGVSLLPIHEPVQDFIVLPKKKHLVYRNLDSQLREVCLKTFTKFPLLDSDLPLSKVVDEDERLLLQAGRPSILDTQATNLAWHHYPANFELKHLYWKRSGSYGPKVLYSLESVFITPDQQQIKIYSFLDGQAKPFECNLPSTKGEIFHIGEGHEYPYIFLYKVRKDGTDSRVVSYKVKINGVLGNNQCRLYMVKPYAQKIAGNILSIHKFPALEESSHEMFVVETDVKEKSFLWDDGPNDCRYYNLGGRKPVILNHKVPVIATIEPKEGITLIYPRKKMGGNPIYVRPLEDIASGAFGPEHVSLSDDGKTLWVANQLRGEAGRLLFKVDLAQINRFVGN